MNITAVENQYLEGEESDGAFDNDDEASDQDQDDVPNYEFEEGEKCVTEKDYLFCPEEHHHQLLHKFTCHFCCHTFFPTPDGKHLSTAQIQLICVYDMYIFCMTKVSQKSGCISGSHGTNFGIYGLDHLHNLTSLIYGYQ